MTPDMISVGLHMYAARHDTKQWPGMQHGVFTGGPWQNDNHPTSMFFVNPDINACRLFSLLRDAAEMDILPAIKQVRMNWRGIQDWQRGKWDIIPS